MFSSRRRGSSSQDDSAAASNSPDSSAYSRPSRPDATGTGNQSASASGPSWADLDTSTSAGDTSASGSDDGPDYQVTSGAYSNVISWIALAIGAALTVWQMVFLHRVGAAVTNGDLGTFGSVYLIVALALSVAAVVLGIVGIVQRMGPVWPALVGLIIGVHVFFASVAGWIGGLIQ